MKTELSAFTVPVCVAPRLHSSPESVFPALLLSKEFKKVCRVCVGCCSAESSVENCSVSFLKVSQIEARELGSVW